MATPTVTSTARPVQILYSAAGRACQCLLCVMIVFSPWAFGTTQDWSIAAMNVGGWTLGLLFLIRRSISNRLGIRLLSRWDVSLLSVTLLLLAWGLVSALNGSAVYLPHEWRLQERPFIPWLPHSYDAPSSWHAFLNYLALAGAFWAAWDGLDEGQRSMVKGERSARDDRSWSFEAPPRLSSRLRTLLFVLSVNGAFLAIEAIIQRTSGTNKLLWFMPTHDNPDAAAQFGPYAYRSNAVQYLNLIWPVTLGFWWWMHHDRTQSMTRRGLHHVLLPCAVIMIAASLYSLSRAGVGVAFMLLLAASSVFATRREASVLQRCGVVTVAVLALAAGLFIAWNTLLSRLEGTMYDPLAGRKETYALALGMARDYQWFGTGPGTFASLFQMYRQNPGQYWPAQLHNDWLEFRITFGRIGFTLMLTALALGGCRWIAPGGRARDTAFLAMCSLALAGCLGHAIVDFPFQIYSVEFLFLVITAILFSSSRAQICGTRR